MDYNQLKIRVLSLFEGSQEMESGQVRKLLEESRVELSDKAVRMALMRYTKQGLLARTRKMGLFHYRLTEKGQARRDWLSRAK